MITANEARALVEKYNEEMIEIAKNLAETFAEEASDKIISAASRGQKTISFEVPNSKVRPLFVKKMIELGFKVKAVEASPVVEIIW